MRDKQTRNKQNCQWKNFENLLKSLAAAKI